MKAPDFTRGRVRVLPALVRHYLHAFALIGGVFMLLSVTFLGLSSIRSAIEAAQRTSARADVAGMPFVVQAGSSEARAQISKVPELIPVMDTGGVVETDSTRSHGTVRSLSDASLTLGTIVDGRAPNRPGEATISRALSKETGVLLGDVARVRRDGMPGLEVTVVGISVDPADVSNRQ